MSSRSLSSDVAPSLHDTALSHTEHRDAPARRSDEERERDRRRLLEMLLSLSYEEREVTLSSGQKSGFYIDCKQTVLTGEGHTLVGRLFLEMLEDAEAKRPNRPAHSAAGGLTMGADPLSSALVLTAFARARSMTAIYVRKDPKGHGTGAYLEGTKSVPDGARVVVVEDVVTTGAATFTAVERLRSHGFHVDTVLAIADRGAGGREALAEHGLVVHALYSLSDFPIGQRGGR